MQVLRVFQVNEIGDCQGLTLITEVLLFIFELATLIPYTLHLICTRLLLRVFDQDDEIGDPQGLTVVTTLVKWNLKADAKKDVCSSLAPLGACY